MHPPIPTKRAFRVKDSGTGTCAGTRVVKRLMPSQPGALKLARRYGDALVCVRYRHDEQRKIRYTTIELVVDQAPISRRIRADELVMVHIDFANASLQELAHAHGARWDEKRRLWRMTYGLTKTLKLVAGIVRPRPPRQG